MSAAAEAFKLANLLEEDARAALAKIEAARGAVIPIRPGMVSTHDRT